MWPNLFFDGTLLAGFEGRALILWKLRISWTESGERRVESGLIILSEAGPYGVGFQGKLESDFGF